MKRLVFVLASTLLTAGVWAQTEPAPAAAGDSHFNKLDTNRDGKVSREEAAGNKHLAKDFDKSDADRDGTISASEMNAARQQKKKAGKAKEANRTIDRSELKGDPKAEARFDRADVNHDGKVTPEESKAAKAKHGGKTPGGATPAAPSASSV